MPPKHYSSLEPFRQLFQTGTPILMYHKIDLRPQGVRLKGLYISPDLFAHQLAELRQHGFQTGSLENSVERADNREQRIILTFDDGFRSVLENALKPLGQHGFHAIQYLVANHIGRMNEWDLRDGEKPEPLMGRAEIKDWLAAGHEIGSHSLTHPRLTRLTLRDAEEEITASKKRLEDLFGVGVNHFCYPYGDWNEATRDLVVEAGYLTASTTQFGVNSKTTPSFSLNRIMARYPTRNWQTLKARLTQMKFV
jgi:peptidoglycan/xylan/chitin deacetylase (PgdA/CDA1 family)